MSDFDSAFAEMLQNEGGYRLHTVEGDRGGMTFAGIARAFHSVWEGWSVIDRSGPGDDCLPDMVKRFYRVNFWDAVRGDEITSDVVASSVFDFAVNAGVLTSIRLAQLSVGATADGFIGPVTVAALNAVEPDVFVSRFALAKIARYSAICNRDRSQSKFLLGWVNRTLKGLM